MKRAYLVIILQVMLLQAIAQTPLVNRSRVTAPVLQATSQSVVKKNIQPDEKEPVGPVVSSGSLTLSIRTINDDYTATGDDHTIIAKPAGLYSKNETIKITLPDAASNPGKIFIIKNASRKIPGSNTRVEIYVPEYKQMGEQGLKYYGLTDWQQVTLQSDGAQWWSVGN